MALPYALNPMGISRVKETTPLTLTAVESSTVELRVIGSPTISGLQYRTGLKENWLAYTPGTVLTLQAGQKVQFFNTSSSLSSSASDYVQFILSGQIQASGNCFSMLNYADRAGYRCFTNLFRNCAGLLTAPELPIEFLAGYCYSGMFRDCTNLVTGPFLPAQSLNAYCYNALFQGCVKLSSVYVNFTDWNNGNSTQNWLSGVATDGTFTKPTALYEQRGASRIPENWTIINK